MHGELDGGVGHANHVVGGAGQQEVVVVPAHVEQGDVDGVDGVVVDSALEGEQPYSETVGVEKVE